MFWTVKSLKEKLEELEKKGYGNKIVVIPEDEEGNSYRALHEQDILETEGEIEDFVYNTDEDVLPLDTHINIGNIIVL